MGVTQDRIDALKEKEKKILEMGGEKAVAKHKEKGKLTARERLNLLFDPGTFREIDMFVSHRCVNFGMEKVEIPSDGVITGHGQVDGRTVFAFAQDFTDDYMDDDSTVDVWTKTGYADAVREIEEYKAGNAASINFLMGQVMKASKGKANPGAVMQMLKKKLEDK